MCCHNIGTTKQRRKQKDEWWGGGESLLLIVHDGGAVSSHGLLFDHTDELEGAAEGSVRIGPFRTLEMSHLQDIVVLSQTTKSDLTRVNASYRPKIKMVLLLQFLSM